MTSHSNKFDLYKNNPEIKRVVLQMAELGLRDGIMTYDRGQ